VRCKPTTSGAYNINAGLPQGIALRGTLFVLYTSDF